MAPSPSTDFLTIFSSSRHGAGSQYAKEFIVVVTIVCVLACVRNISHQDAISIHAAKNSKEEKKK
eukprot:scaffold18694_cov53-Cyclotella_meneghiniana.AAC.5